MPYPKKAKGDKYVPVHITIPPDAKKRLDEIKKATGFTYSKIVTRLILEGCVSVKETSPSALDALIERQRISVEKANNLLKKR